MFRPLYYAAFEALRSSLGEGSNSSLAKAQQNLEKILSSHQRDVELVQQLLGCHFMGFRVQGFYGLQICSDAIFIECLSSFSTTNRFGLYRRLSLLMLYEAWLDFVDSYNGTLLVRDSDTN